MIKYCLKCKICSLEFESWFSSSTEFDRLKKLKHLNCQKCNSTKIEKTLMTPNLTKKTNSKKINNSSKTVINKIEKYKKIIEKNFDYVGENFTEEAKKIKYGESDERPIYGEATIEQTKDLIEEEIDVVPLPWGPTKKTN